MSQLYHIFRVLSMIYPDIHQSRNHIQNKTIDKYHIAGILSEKSTAVDITNELAESQKALGIMLSPTEFNTSSRILLCSILYSNIAN